MEKPLFFFAKYFVILIILQQFTTHKQKKIVGILSLSTNTVSEKIEQKYEKGYFDLQNILLDDYLNYYSSFVSSDYQIWLETVSIDIVPIDINMDIEQIFKRIDMLSGLLLTGGGQEFFIQTQHGKEMSPYLQKVNEIVKFIKKINKKQRVFPLWATCLGFEALIVSESDFKLERSKIYNHDHVIVPLHIVNYKTESAQFFTENELKEIQNQNLFYFHHSWAISQEQFEDIKELDQYKIVANYENDNQKYIAWIEHQEYPIFATQFHPEQMTNQNKNPHDSKQFYRFYINQKLALLFKKHLTNFTGNFKKLEEGLHIVNVYNIGMYKKLILLDSLDN